LVTAANVGSAKEANGVLERVKRMGSRRVCTVDGAMTESSMMGDLSLDWCRKAHRANNHAVAFKKTLWVVERTFGWLMGLDY